MNLSEIIVDVHLVLVSENLVEISLSFFFLKFPQSKKKLNFDQSKGKKIVYKLISLDGFDAFLTKRWRIQISILFGAN